MSDKKYASLNTLSIFLNNLKKTFATLTHTHKLEDVTDFNLDMIYSVGSIYTTEDNINPANLLGFGTWSLIDKEFIEQYGSSSSEYFTVTENINSVTVAYVRSGKCLGIRLMVKINDTTLGEDDLEFGTLNLSSLGITRFPYTFTSMTFASDGGNAIMVCSIGIDGKLTYHDIHSKGTPKSNSNFYGYIEIPLTMSCIKDEFCNKFHWKRIA